MVVCIDEFLQKVTTLLIELRKLQHYRSRSVRTGIMMARRTIRPAPFN